MKKTFFICTILFLCSCAVFGQNLADGKDNNQSDISLVHQLRIYEIPKKIRFHFNDRFKNHAARIMNKYGFKIIATWESEFENKLEFVYLLEWKDKATMESSWSKFMSDQEWKDIKAATSKLHGTYVNNIEDRILILTDYSPKQQLLSEK